jgi:CDP-paratose 2-epimerase
MLEAIRGFEALIGKRLRVEYVEEPRVGDHICYISDLRAFRRDYPGWQLTRGLDDIFRELAPDPRGRGA